MNEEQWVDKYKPTKLEDIIGHQNTINNLKTYIEEIKDDNLQLNKNIILIGDGGIGKTLIVNLILEKLNYRIHYYDCSNINSSNVIKETISQSLYQQNVLEMMMNDNKKTAVIIEELDALFELGHKGYFKELLSLLRNTKNDKKRNNSPLILTLNSKNEKKLINAIRCCKIFYLNTPSEDEIKNVIDNIYSTLPKKILKTKAYDYFLTKLSIDHRQNIVLFENLIKSTNDIITTKYIKCFLKTKKKDEINILHSSIYTIFNSTNISFKSLEDIYYSDQYSIPNIINDNYINAIFYKTKTTNKNLKKQIKTISILSEYLLQYDRLNNIIFENYNWIINQYIPYFTVIPVNYYVNKCNKNIITNECLKNTSLHSQTTIILRRNKKFKDYIINNILFTQNNIIHLLSFIKLLLIDKNKPNILYNNILSFYNFKCNDIETLVKLDKDLNKQMAYIKKLIKIKIYK